MKAIVLEKLDSASPLEVTDIAVPAITDTEVLVKTVALSINPVDVKTLEDYKVITDEQTIRASAAAVFDGVSPVILGWDLAGIVEAVGSKVTKFKVGDAVFGMVNFPGQGKVYAEYVAAPASHLALKPDNISFDEAAAATLAAVTAWQNLTRHYTVKQGDRILITAPTGGVGHYAIQMAKHLGAYVIAITQPASKALASSFGADEVLDYDTFDLDHAASLQLNLLLDLGGRLPATRFTRHLLPGAPVLYVPSVIPDKQQQHYHDQGLNVSFTMVHSEESAIDEIAQLLKDGSVTSHIDSVFDFTAMRAAFDTIHQGTTKGKIIIRMPR
ncbi:NADP-dependent oxidoreductase [Chitinophaga sp. HK235]|uniref:NADP-dependent oxidoreductase n=1 Tax=Chitinophaga sp. HK235 TaxID=2952571 RepID=UPI001BA9B48C|nr:NADP-dependent oxidoreductase [Chitinophaga sp. HK235]